MKKKIKAKLVTIPLKTTFGIGMGRESNASNTGETSDYGFEAQTRALPLVKQYRKEGKKLSSKMRRQLLQYVVEALLKEGRSLVTKGGIVTRKTEIRPFIPGKEWDLDASLDKILGSGDYESPTYSDLLSKDIIRSRRNFIIMGDKSNSLGPVIDYVALAVSILSEAVKSENYALMFFDDQVRVIKSVLGYVEQSVVLEEILNIECKGATDLHKVFVEAKMQLDLTPGVTDDICILISDCVPTVGDDPLIAASLLPKLTVLLVNNEGCLIGDSCADKLEKLPQVKIHQITELSDIIDAIQEIVSYGDLETAQ